MQYSTIKAHYSGDARAYTFRCPIELMRHLSVGDVVAVLAGNGLGLVKVLELHGVPQDKGNYNWKWAFQKIDLGNAEFLDRLQKHEITPSGFDPDFDDDIPF